MPTRLERLTDRTWPTAPLVALGVAVAVAVGGIVGAPRATQTERVADAVQELARAVQERRGEDACARLTPAAQRAVAAQTGTLGCAATVRSFGLGVDAAALRAARVTGAAVVGDRATIAREQLLAPGGQPFGRAITLERRDGDWRIAALT